MEGDGSPETGSVSEEVADGEESGSVGVSEEVGTGEEGVGSAGEGRLWEVPSVSLCCIWKNTRLNTQARVTIINRNAIAEKTIGLILLGFINQAPFRNLPLGVSLVYHFFPRNSRPFSEFMFFLM